MPIFHDPHERPLRRPSLRQMSAHGQQRVGSPRAEFDVSLPDSLVSRERTVQNAQHGMGSESPYYGRKPFDRVDLIERLKRTKSPTWQQHEDVDYNHDQDTEPRPHSRDRPKTPLPPSIETEALRTPTSDSHRDPATVGLEIERPRSALHSGDFREKKSDGSSASGSTTAPFLATSPVAPWNLSFPTAARASQKIEASYSFNRVFGHEPRAVSRARAISQSSTTSFTFLPPTSPLVQQANNTDLDFTSRSGSRQASRSPERDSRRHTISPAAFSTYHTTSLAFSTTGTPAARHLRSGSSIPYQAHQPRRSMTFSQEHAQSNPQSPYLNSRRPSFSSEASPLQHAPMVGSYEESILRGRMSTTPSRPLDFVAKIGVLGRGQCKPSLKCPPHVTVPFPAVFYSYNTGNGRISDNEPSPYVGLIDLENSLPTPKISIESGNRKRRHAASTPGHDDLDVHSSHLQEDNDRNLPNGARKREKRRRRSTSPKAPPGGSYRIPAQGQLQIVLKNPNNTAVKLFLVPYDLSDMQPGQKTFIRQRSYSAGPIIDMPTSSRKNLGTDRPEAALSNSDDPNDRPILRYLVHLHICCPSKDRYFLYKSVRVVFANRVPDGKEKLRNEIQQPEPRYSIYKPTRDTATSQSNSSMGGHVTAEKSLRRRSAGWPLSRSQQAYDQLDGLVQRPTLPPPAVKFTGGTLSSSASSGFSSPMPDLQPIPFTLTRLAAIESRPVSREQMDIDTKSAFRASVASPNSGLSSPTGSHGTFEKLNKGDVGYGGNAFSPLASPTSPPSAGLLSQRLRGLEVQYNDDSDD